MDRTDSLQRLGSENYRQDLRQLGPRLRWQLAGQFRQQTMLQPTNQGYLPGQLFQNPSRRKRHYQYAPNRKFHFHRIRRQLCFRSPLQLILINHSLRTNRSYPNKSDGVISAKPSFVKVGGSCKGAFERDGFFFASEYFLQDFYSIATTDDHVFHCSFLHLYAMEFSR